VGALNRVWPKGAHESGAGHNGSAPGDFKQKPYQARFRAAVAVSGRRATHSVPRCLACAWTLCDVEGALCHLLLQ
jgi:hypothetical protein